VADELSRRRAALEQRIAELEAENAELRAARPRVELKGWAQGIEVDVDELERLLASVSDYLWSASVNTDGTFSYRYYSPVIEKITGHPPSFYLAGGWPSIIHPEDVDSILDIAGRMVSGELEQAEREYRIIRPDGEVRWVHDRVVAIARPDGTTLLNGVVRDVTERIQAEQQARQMELTLRQAHRMESLGLLAGSIAHDFNNLLVGVLGSIDLALLELPSEHLACEELARAQTAGCQCAELCQQLLAYSGKGHFVIEPFSLPELVEEMRRLLDASIRKSHTIICEIDGEVPAVAGDVIQFRQILMNLITNASEAMNEEAGEISISITALDATAQELAGAYGGDELQPGTYVSLEVRDAGRGMDRETIERIFDPFYTTKFIGHGLGLAAVVGIVRGHGGGIWVDSEPGRGTTFRLLFPTAEEAVAPRPVAHERPVGAAGAATVLLVDDDEHVRATARQMLERKGYEVITAVDGDDALERYAKEHDKISVVLLDMTMPNRDGKATLAALEQMDPLVRVVMTSGYNEHAIQQELADNEPVAFIQKPFRLPQLDAAIRAALGKPPA
jgi:PAS domain S-box-containing protein